MRIINETRKLMTMDTGSCYTKENKFDFLNEVAVEANAYAESNRDEYGSSKKTIMHVLSNESLSH